MKKTSKFTLRIYKLTISPILVFLFGKGCRYSPTCSEYAEEAIEKYGILKGLKLSLFRIGRCHPFARGYFDPVP